MTCFWSVLDRNHHFGHIKWQHSCPFLIPRIEPLDNVSVWRTKMSHFIIRNDHLTTKKRFQISACYQTIIRRQATTSSTNQNRFRQDRKWGLYENRTIYSWNLIGWRKEVSISYGPMIIPIFVNKLPSCD